MFMIGQYHRVCVVYDKIPQVYREGEIIHQVHFVSFIDIVTTQFHLQFTLLVSFFIISFDCCFFGTVFVSF
uniref:Phosphatidylinositol-glycan biosynthesis class W protein n=1 Tax=Parascaris univalens TaxID=6257 RepID=A0A915BHM8_PARUN